MKRPRLDATLSMRRGSRGFTYLGVLFMAVAMGIALAAVGEVWRSSARRDKEAELLFVGREYRNAIDRYYKNSSGVAEYPRSLEDLLLDRRHPQVRRYLRRLYADPLSPPGAPWGLVKVGDRIIGVYSLAAGRPFKQAGFEKGDESFADAGSYADWRFVFSGAAPAGSEGGGGMMPPGIAGAPPGTPAVVAPPEPPAPERPTDRCQMQRDSESAACFGIPEVGKRFDCLRSAALRQNACSNGRDLPPLKL